MYSLRIPDDVHQWAEKIAKQNNQTVDEVLMMYVRLVSQNMPVLPADEESELAALKYLSDDALWTIARDTMAQNEADRMKLLMDKNSAGTITGNEFSELEKLVERGQKLTLRKSEAMAILTERGYSVSLKDMPSSE